MFLLAEHISNAELLNNQKKIVIKIKFTRKQHYFQITRRVVKNIAGIDTVQKLYEVKLKEADGLSISARI